MSEKEMGVPAFPVHPDIRDDEPHAGMTLRDYFAGQALTGLVLSKGGPYAASKDDFAKESYWLADAMLEARK